MRARFRKFVTIQAVMPAKAGIQSVSCGEPPWIPAFAGMTGRKQIPGSLNSYKKFRILFCLALVFLLTGCQVLNNKWIRVKRGKNPDAARSRLRIPNFMGPKGNVERFFQSYGQKDWRAMDGAFSTYSDLHFIKDGVLLDFETYVEIIPEVIVGNPVFNSAEDRAQVDVEFVIEKIHRLSGSLVQSKGRGTFVLTEKGSWDILGYVGDPFWSDIKK